MILPYLTLEQTRPNKAFFLHVFQQQRRFLLRNPSVEFAFLQMLLICVFSFKLSEIVRPLYGLSCTCLRI